MSEKLDKKTISSCPCGSITFEVEFDRKLRAVAEPAPRAGRQRCRSASPTISLPISRPESLGNKKVQRLCPNASAAPLPNIHSAPRLQKRMTRSRSLATSASELVLEINLFVKDGERHCLTLVCTEKLDTTVMVMKSAYDRPGWLR